MNRLPRSVFAVAPLLLAALACGSPPRDAGETVGGSSEAIKNGTNDVGTDLNDRLHRDVVVRLSTSGGGCSATLIAPRVVLTARHCVRGSYKSGPFHADTGTIYIGADTSSQVSIDSDPSRPILPVFDSPVDLGDGDTDTDAALIYLPFTAPHTNAATGDLFMTRPTFNTTSPEDMVLLAAGYAPAGGPIRQLGGFVVVNDPVANGTSSYIRAIGPSALQHGDSGGPLFFVHPDGTRDVRGIAARCPNSDCDGPDSDFADVASEFLRNWIKSNAQDTTRSAAWMTRHGKTMGDFWLGEADYVGPCRPDVDPDCDHWFNAHDNCPTTPNPDQLDADDNGQGDDCRPIPPPPPAAPMCSLSSTCDNAFVPPRNGTPGHYQTYETVTGTCVSQASVMQQLVNGQWVNLPAYIPNQSYPDATPNKFSIGQQSDIGGTTSGAPVGSVQTVRACATGAGGTSCDYYEAITVRSCCTPITTCSDNACGTISNGCGGTITCTAGCGKTCTVQKCGVKEKWNPTSCECESTCTTPKCGCEAAGGTWSGNHCI